MSFYSMKQLHHLFFIALTLAFTGSYGQGTDPINKQLERCLRNSTTNEQMMGCQVAARKSWSEELTKYYTLYHKALLHVNQPILEIAQWKWENYRDSEFRLIEAHYSTQTEGNMWMPVIEGKKMEIVRARALRLRSAYEYLLEMK